MEHLAYMLSHVPIRLIDAIHRIELKDQSILKVRVSVFRVLCIPIQVVGEVMKLRKCVLRVVIEEVSAVREEAAHKTLARLRIGSGMGLKK
jgi:hypothetical protein